MSDMFLSRDDVAILTGRKTKSKQIESLRKMGIQFWVNAVGYPVVPRAAIEGRKTSPASPEKRWEMPRRDPRITPRGTS
jgi:hypothetical protein